MHNIKQKCNLVKGEQLAVRYSLIACSYRCILGLCFVWLCLLGLHCSLSTHLIILDIFPELWNGVTNRKWAGQDSVSLLDSSALYVAYDDISVTCLCISLPPPYSHSQTTRLTWQLQQVFVGLQQNSLGGCFRTIVHGFKFKQIYMEKIRKLQKDC